MCVFPAVLFIKLAGFKRVARVRDDEESDRLIVRETSRGALYFIASFGRGELHE
jgi:hypothetical protein